MNKEQVEQRLAIIEKQIAHASAQLNMLMGHKQEALHWLSEFNKPVDLKAALDTRDSTGNVEVQKANTV